MLNHNFAQRGLVYRVILKAAVIFLGASLGGLSVRGQTALILGDSHTVGDFGEYLHRQIHALGRYDVLSLGLGGAGSYHYTVPLKNFCCGFRLRESCRGESLPKNQKVRVLEEGFGASQEYVLPGFGSRLERWVEAYRPELIIVALGSNFTNAHSQLLKLLRSANPQARIVWVAPFRRTDYEKRLALIEAAARRDGGTIVIRSDDILGHDTLKTAHFSGTLARRWAAAIAERLKEQL
ncbi:MAG: SGNH/GDSL hydrolase family protein [Flavobacteriales bacterium]|nr:SGNH/GDSL hydrolase family protein [Flavobacteriales bacterium]MDW8432343.1 SGNH/GDSL hydrolase family protein [Flavobacteriales bacterium]